MQNSAQEQYTTRVINAFETRVRDAISLLRNGNKPADVRLLHGKFVLAEAQNRLLQYWVTHGTC